MNPYVKPSDEDLVTAGCRGDLYAFETLVVRYQQEIYLDALQYLHEPTHAQEIVQEIFLAAFQQLSRLKEARKFGSWLHSMVRNRCLNAIRDHRRAAMAYEQWQKDCVKVDAPDPGGSDMREVVHDLLTHLPEASVQVVLMRYLDDLPIAAISQRLGISPQAVKQRLYRARHLLHEEVVAMVKDKTKKNQFPAGFSGRVMAKILEEGRENWLYMRYEQAQARFKDAIEAMPDDPEALLAYGGAYDPMRGAQSEHVEVLERAAEQAPASIPVLGALASAYRQCGQKEAWETRSRRCLDLCDRHLATDPKDLAALRTKAEILRLNEDYTGAEQLLRMAHEDAPEDQELIHFLALNLSQQGRHAEAAPLYENNHRLNPRTQWAYFALRQLATDLAFRRPEDPQQAVAYMEEVWELTRRPNEADNLIYFYSATEQLDEAIRVFDSVTMPQHHPRVYVTVGIGYMRCGEWEKAQKSFRSAINLTTDDPLRAEAHLYLAFVLFASEQVEEAHTALKAGLTLDPNARSTLLTGGPTSIFWRPWSLWFTETLHRLSQYDGHVESLLHALRSV